jgi:hypothetical protein
MDGHRIPRRAAALVVTTTLAALLAGCAYLAPASVTNGTSNVGNGFSNQPAISSTGRYVAFTSTSNNLVVNDNNVAADVFVHDNVTGATERVSVSTGGTEADSDSSHPAISADGRYVAFESLANNLVAGDTNGVSDVFVRDRVAQTTTRVSVTTAGVQGDGASTRPSISADGSVVAFASASTNLAGGQVPTSGTNQVYTRHRSGTVFTQMVGARTCLLLTGSVIEANGPSFDPVISGDGSTVAFWSTATDLVTPDTNALPDVFVVPASQHCFAWHVDMLDVDGNGSNANSFGQYPTISFDGRFVAYRGANGALSLVRFVRRDRANATDTLFDTPPFPGSHASLSADGTRLAYTQQAGNNQYQAYVRDFGTNSSVLVSTSQQLAPGYSLADADASPAMAGNGDYVAFARDDSQVVTRYVTVPTIASVSPNIVAKGSSGTLWISGSNFRPGSRVYSDNAALQLGAVSYFSPGLLLVSYTATSQTGTASIYVALPDGFAPNTSAAAQCQGCVSVT